MGARRSRRRSSSSRASRTLRDDGAKDPVLADAIAGELISSEIEIRSGRGEDVAARAARCSARRAGGCSRWPTRTASALASTGTHPLSDYREQHIIDTEHYHRVEDGLKYVAWRNNTFALQVHVGVQGGDRAIQVCDRLRPVLPLLLAISANSPFVDGRDSGLHSGAHADLHEVVPALRHPGRRSAPGQAWQRLRRRCCCARTRSSSSPSCGGRCARTTPSGRSRCASATRRPPAPRPTRWSS